MAGSGPGASAGDGAGPGRPAKAGGGRASSAGDGTAAAGLAMPGDADADRRWLAEAIELSRCCPPSATAFSREGDRHDHAEEVALAKAVLAGPARAAAPRAGSHPGPGAPPAGSQPSHADPRLPGATLYS